MKNLILIIIACLLFSSCKKDSTTTVPTSTTSGGQALNNGAPSGTTTVNGVFLAYKFATLPSTNASYESFAALYRTGQQLQTINPTSTVVIGHDYGGAIKINNSILKFETVNPSYLHRYTDTLLTPNYSQTIDWAFTGDTSFAAFDVNIARGFPVISNPNLFPNNISKTQTLTINFGPSNISNSDSIAVQLSGTSLNVYRTVAGNSSSISFSTAELSSAIIGGTMQLTLFLKNYSNVAINNKTYVYILVNSFTGYATINP